MSLLIAMAVHNTPENQRYKTTHACIKNTMRMLENTDHEFYIIDNASTCKETQEYLDALEHTEANIIRLSNNVGTAMAINYAWRNRKQGQHAVKMDNDVIIHDLKAFEQMAEAIEREPRIGIIGLKRKDCWEHPAHENRDLQSEMVMLPHVAGQRWVIVEKVFHVMGTCQMYNSALLDQIGYLYQPSLYGYDDVLAAHRCHHVGMWSVFLTHVEIDHIDPGDTPYQKWKEDHSGEVTELVMNLAREYRRGIRSVYHNPFT